MRSLYTQLRTTLLLILSATALATDPDAVKTPQQLEEMRLQGPYPDPILQAFLEAHPQHPIGNWSQGEIWSGKHWVTHQAAMGEQAGRADAQYEYQQARGGLPDSFEAHVQLANACREHRLYAEERAHLERALLHNYAFHEGHRRLGHLNVDGLWITPQQILTTAREAMRLEANLRDWSDRVAQFEKRLSRTQPASPAEKEAIQLIMDTHDPDMIPAMEGLFAPVSPRHTLVFQDWLAQMESRDAGAALCRQAVLHSSAELRIRAAKLLRNRRFDTFVPSLMDGLTTTQTRYDTDFVFRRWGVTADYMIKSISRVRTIDSFDRTLTVTQRVHFMDRQDSGFFEKTANSVTPTRGWELFGPRFSKEELPGLYELASARFGDYLMANYGQQALDSFQQVQQDRVMRTLSTATGEELDSAEDWYNWWRNHNEFLLKDGKFKVNDQYDDGLWYVDNRDVQRVDRVVRNIECSCFTADTVVETENGPKAIGEIQLGDCVLSEDIETGELAFKPVLAHTIRPEAPTLTIKTPADELHCSPGHPFWVSGKGWRMAKELEPGMSVYLLHGMRLDVTEVVPGETATVHNLIVADFGTYFAGINKLLTHDVLPRPMTDMALPGIRKTFE